jgi:hypothetical protein
MEKTNKTPIWVFLAYSSINTRKGALLLINACILFTIYCIPWPLLMPESELIKSIFLIDDWSWLAMMVPIVIWYILALKWMDKNNGWEQEEVLSI